LFKSKPKPIQVSRRTVASILLVGTNPEPLLPMLRLQAARLIWHSPLNVSSAIDKFLVPSEEAEQALAANLADTVQLLTTIKSVYTTEMALLQRIIYKNSNQHRNAKYFIRLKQVCLNN